jgi:hypothetical protein
MAFKKKRCMDCNWRVRKRILICICIHACYRGLDWGQPHLTKTPNLKPWIMEEREGDRTLNYS